MRAKVDIGRILKMDNYQYLEWLCNQIEEFGAAVKKQNPERFIYRGIDLQKAFEVACYFTASGDPEFKSNVMKRQPPEKKGLYEILYDLSSTEKYFKRDAFEITKNWVKLNFKRLLSRYSRRNQTFEHRYKKYLCYVQNPKFANFFQPIIKKNADDFAILSPPRADLTKLSTSVPVITGGARGYLSNIEFPLSFFPAIYEKCDYFLEILSEQRPKIVFLPEGNAPDDAILAEVCKKIGIKTICIQQGWAPIVHTGFRNMKYDLMLTWGDAFNEVLQPFNPRQKFLAVGNHMMREARISNTNSGCISFFLQTQTALISSKVWFDFIALIERTALSMPDFQILVRVHPSHPIEKEISARLLTQKNIQIVSQNELALALQLEKSIVSISIYSSTLYESIACGSVPIIFSPERVNMNPDLAKSDLAIRVTNIDSALSEISRVVRSDIERKKFKDRMKLEEKRYFKSVGEDTVNRIFETLEAL